MEMRIEWRIVGEIDLDRLAVWNSQLIEDEGHRNSMTVPELRRRMKKWLEGDYCVVLFEAEGTCVAYALYIEIHDEIYLRQFFVARERRREGIGRIAFGLLKDEVWPTGKRLTVEVLVKNEQAVAFWRKMGYRDYCLKLEM